jgi:hypothetical protein
MPLDGSSESWWVKANEKVYGPYTRMQMRRFLVEGRVTSATLVSLKPDADWTEARHCRAFREVVQQERSSFHVAPAKRDHNAEIAVANLLVWADIVSGASRRFEHELHKLGAVAEVTPGLYIVRTPRTAGAMRNTLSQTLDRGDKVLVVDASRDRLAWFNLGPETDVRIREVWNAEWAETAEPA